jgi:RimJ/RimL family protein N-acetyltransferase
MIDPPLTTRHVRLRPILQGDITWLHAASLAEDIMFRWRYRGATPSPEAFAQGLFHGVLSQFVVDGMESRRGPIGHVTAYNADLQGGTVFFGVTAFPPFLETGLAIEASLLFLNYLFSTFRLRKIYVETTEDALGNFRSGLPILHEEARLVAHEFYQGHYVDRITFALYRNEMRQFLARFGALFTATFESELP